MILSDVFITTKGRPKLLDRSLQSFFDNTDSKKIKLTIFQDGVDEETSRVLDKYNSKFDNVLVSRENCGLGVSFNKILNFIDQHNKYYDHPTHGDKNKVSEFITYCQDDILYSPQWLEKLIKFYCLFENQHKLAFASGIESVEHDIVKDIGNGMLLKNWVRLTNLVARRKTWMEFLPIPIKDPETGKVRGKPNDGIGSSTDWWLCRNHEKSLVKSGRNCLVIPSLLTHFGYKDSTWLKTKLPENLKDLDLANKELEKL